MGGIRGYICSHTHTRIHSYIHTHKLTLIIHQHVEDDHHYPRGDNLFSEKKKNTTGCSPTAPSQFQRCRFLSSNCFGPFDAQDNSLMLQAGLMRGLETSFANWKSLAYNEAFQQCIRPHESFNLVARQSITNGRFGLL